MVAYLKQGKAVKGKKELSSFYEGVVYLFSSEVNKEIFLRNSSVNETQYGCWCVFLMGDSGDKVEIYPNIFKIVEDKLYLFFNSYFRNTLKRWNLNQVYLKGKANSNWKKGIQ